MTLVLSWRSPNAPVESEWRDQPEQSLGIATVVGPIGPRGGVLTNVQPGTPRSGTISPDASRYNFIAADNLTGDAHFDDPIGSPGEAERMIIRVSDDGNGLRALTWGAAYKGGTVVIPASTSAGAVHYLGFIFNSSKDQWDLVASIVVA